MWTDELQRHCQEVYDDKGETILKHEERIKKYTKEGDRHFTEERRIVEITIDLVLRERTSMAEEKVNGPEDSVVTDISKRLPSREGF